MNHNGTIDRFENDEEADLPYRRDREGYNVFAGAHLLPGVRLMLGRTDMRRLAAEERSEALYGVLTFDRDFNRWGRVRLFQDLRKVRDNIADPVLQWRQRPNTRGALYGVEDPLAARNTVLNTSWFGWEQRPFAGLRLEHKAKWQFHRQLDSRIDVELRGQRQTASFLGVINKAEYRLSAGGVHPDAALEERILAPPAGACGDAGPPRTRRTADAGIPLPAAAQEHGRGWRGIRDLLAVAKSHATQCRR